MQEKEIIAAGINKIIDDKYKSAPDYIRQKIKQKTKELIDMRSLKENSVLTFHVYDNKADKVKRLNMEPVF